MIDRRPFNPIDNFIGRLFDEESNLRIDNLTYNLRKIKRSFAVSVTAEIRNLCDASELEQQQFLESLLKRLKSEEYFTAIIDSIKNATPEGITLIRNRAIRQSINVAKLVIATFIQQIEYILEEEIDLNSEDYKSALMGGYQASAYARYVMKSEIKANFSFVPVKFGAIENIKRAQRIVFNSLKN